MKKYLGPLSLLLSLNTYATSTNSVLILRAIVPEVMKVEVKMDKHGPKAVLHTNHKGPHSAPKFLIKKTDTHYLVSITHP